MINLIMSHCLPDHAATRPRPRQLRITIHSLSAPAEGAPFFFLDPGVR